MPSATERCTTCGDAAAVVRIVERDGSDAVCADEDGERCTVALDFVPEAGVGDAVLAHFGVAIARVRGSVVR